MDFVKKILHQISRKSEAVSQITFDEDYNLSLIHISEPTRPY